MDDEPSPINSIVSSPSKESKNDLYTISTYIIPNTLQNTTIKAKIPTFNPNRVGIFGYLQNIPVSIRIHLTSCNHDFVSRLHYLKTKNEQILKKKKEETDKLDFYEALQKSLNAWFRKEQRCRFAFLKLVQVWIYKKYKTRILNLNDPITIVIPQTPVYIFDVKIRGMYVFEASTLINHIDSELLYSEWLFPKSKHPRNPLTNIEFTDSQKLSIL